MSDNDLFYIPAAPITNTNGINERRMAQVENVRERSGVRVNPPVFTDTTKNVPRVTARRNFGIGQMNANLRKRG